MNLQNIFNEIEKADPEVYERLDGRRSAVKSLASFTGKVALSAAPIAFGSLFKKAYGQSVSPQIIEVLNFALTLEYLEAEYYARGLAAPGLIPVGPGRAAIETIGRHEAEHVSFLMTTISSLGGMPVKKPAFDFTAHGTFPDVFTNYELFLAGAQVFEDTGVRAYKGQAGNLISSNEILRAALRIHSVEARHASHVREMRIQSFGAPVKPWITLKKSGIGGAGGPAVQPSYDGEELVVQAGINLVGINGSNISAEAASEAFDEPLTKAQVLAIVTPFLA
ncbi:MAG TPA: ferritin-like domain-containing protein [Segetibacter sp.]|nr:ferritin-like domain-containing protein [Segetibacter sp.]